MKQKTRTYSKRKLVHGVGINDASHFVCERVNNKRTICPFYDVWAGMLKRCYSSKYHSRFPTYKKCSVVKEWHTFSNFESWMMTKDFEKKQLDKDVLYPGNKTYGPETCEFVTCQVNSLLLDCAARRGKYPIGVSLNKTSRKFMANMYKNGKNVHIGSFTNPEEAYIAYISEKVAYIIEVAQTQPDNIKEGLLRHADIMANSS